MKRRKWTERQAEIIANGAIDTLDACAAYLVACADGEPNMKPTAARKIMHACASHLKSRAQKLRGDEP